MGVDDLRVVIKKKQFAFPKWDFGFNVEAISSRKLIQDTSEPLFSFFVI